MTTTLPETFNIQDEFPSVDYEQWRALVDKSLKGAPFEKKLITHTYDGIDIQPIYTRAEEIEGDAVLYAPPIVEPEHGDTRRRRPSDDDPAAVAGHDVAQDERVRSRHLICPSPVEALVRSPRVDAVAVRGCDRFVGRASCPVVGPSPSTLVKRRSPSARPRSVVTKSTESCGIEIPPFLMRATRPPVTTRIESLVHLTWLPTVWTVIPVTKPRQVQTQPTRAAKTEAPRTVTQATPLRPKARRTTTADPSGLGRPRTRTPRPATR